MYRGGHRRKGRKELKNEGAGDARERGKTKIKRLTKTSVTRGCLYIVSVATDLTVIKIFTRHCIRHRLIGYWPTVYALGY